MQTLKFKTNINCGGCIKAVTPHLDKAEDIKSWEVDIVHPEKILTIEVESVDPGKVKQIIEKAGFKAIPIA